MKNRHFVVYWNKEGKLMKEGHKRGGFTSYADAIRWAFAKVMNGYVYGVFEEPAECPKPICPKPMKSNPPSRPMRLSLHTNQLWTPKQLPQDFAVSTSPGYS